MTERSRPKVLVVCGYFDWFSGYQEVGLARALTQYADTHVLAGDRVSPLFSNDHLSQIGEQRRYPTGCSYREGVQVTRLPCREVRSMVWSPDAAEFIREGEYDLVIQVMPGQGLPAAASLSGDCAPRAVLYGDNSAMYAALSRKVAAAKFLVFAATKGGLYRFVNRRASRVYGYTPNTVRRLRWFGAGKTMHVLPLAFDEKLFRPSPGSRARWRSKHGYGQDDFVILAAGKIQAQKRIDDLILAYAGIGHDNPRMRLHIVGADASQATATLRRSVLFNGLQDLVTIQGFVEANELSDAFNGADLGVWPVMPAITIQQAMGTGLPVVIPSNDVVGHLVTDAISGLTYHIAEPLSVALRDVLLEATSLFGPAQNDDNLRLRRASANRWLSTSSLAERLLRDAGFLNGEE